MSGFSEDWLSLREPLDAVSRSATLHRELVEVLRRNNPPGRAIHVTDLGSGTAANLRYLAPLIGGPQDWLLVDNDSTLLEVARCESGLAVAVRSMCADLAHELDRLALPDGGLVTASALLDLVSQDWLAKLAERCAKARAAVCFPLIYDGRIQCRPEDPEDAIVRELVNTHQRTDKGFGPALGPAAAPVAQQTFADCNYQTWSAPSDWHAGPAQEKLQRALLEGWFSAARETAPEQEPSLQKWLERRRTMVDRGQSELIVGHLDLIGWPFHET